MIDSWSLKDKKGSNIGRKSLQLFFQQYKKSTKNDFLFYVKILYCWFFLCGFFPWCILVFVYFLYWGDFLFFLWSFSAVDKKAVNKFGVHFLQVYLFRVEFLFSPDCSYRLTGINIPDCYRSIQWSTCQFILNNYQTNTNYF